MQVQRLSPTSLWIEMPLSIETPPLVWRALAAAGLSQGKINSYRPAFFDPGIPGHEHLVEGHTAKGIFQDNARIVVELLAENGGTRLEVSAFRTDGATDLGFRLRTLKRHYAEAIGQFLQAVSTEALDNEDILLPPLASPDARDERVRFVEAQNGMILPLHVQSPNVWKLLWSGWKENWKAALAYAAAGVIALWCADRFDLWGPFFLGFAAFQIWTSATTRMRFDWFSFLLFLIVGLWRTSFLLHRWL